MLQKKHLLAVLLLVGFSIPFSSTAYAQATKVDVIYPETSDNQQVLSLIGTVDAQQNAQLAPLQSGVVADLFVEEGDWVTKGQSLMALDAKLAELSLAQVEASLKAAQAAQKEAERLYHEVVDLSKRQLVAETLLAERQSALAVANANLNQTTAQLEQQKEVVSRHVLYAPFAGVIAARNIDVGEWVTQQTTTFTLVEQAKLRLRVSIPQEYASQLRNNQDIKVVVVPDHSGAAEVAVKLDRLVKVAAGSSRTLTGLVDLPANPNWVAGMSARADIYLPTQSDNLVWLPKSAIKQHPDGGRSIFAIINKQAKRYIVTVVQQRGEQVAVSGVPQDLPIVSSGVELLQDGKPLEIGSVTGDRS